MTIKDQISLWLGDLQDDMVKKYDELGFRASGQWAASLENDVTEKDGNYKATIQGANYTYWMEHGRKSGKFPPINAIRQWIDDKGIVAKGISRNSLAFLIARKIANEGTKIRPGIVSDVFTQARVDQLVEKLRPLFVDDVKSDVITILK